jgi:glycosyltransferase involved in cell wall biosynthesis
MSQPRVSIIINNYNYGCFLRKAIDSALSQTHEGIQILVVDDGSTDNSHQVILSYGNKITPIFKQNGGQASALNAGFRDSTGDIIIFLDSDDYLYSQTVEEVVAVWERGIAKIQYRLQVVNEDGQPLGVHPPKHLKMDSGELWPVLKLKGRYVSPVMSGNSFSRHVLEAIFPIPEKDYKIAADGYLITLAPFYGKVLSIDYPLGAYRMHGNNLWAATQGLQPMRLSQFVQHDLLRYKLLQSKAQEMGLDPTDKLGLRDYIHLQTRLASLKINPTKHPISSDVAMTLTGKSITAVWHHSNISLFRKIILSIWFLWVGILPKSFAQPAIILLLIPRSGKRLSLNLSLRSLTQKLGFS